MDHVNFTRMVITLWLIWYAHRKAIYESIFQSPQQTVNFVNNYISDLGLITAQEYHPAPTSPAQERPLRWLRPPAGNVKINVDGALARRSRGGAVAVLCRDQDGVYLGSAAVVFHHTRDPLLLETYACQEALALADDLGVRNIYVASDS